jgi:hypothetical protein
VKANLQLLLSAINIEQAPLGTRRESVSQISTGEIGDADTDAATYHATRTVAAGGLDSIDLKETARDILGVSVGVAFSVIEMVAVENLSSLSGDILHVGANPTNRSGTYSVRLDPGAWAGLCNGEPGWPVTQASRYLHIANMGTRSISYSIVIIGRKE